MNAHNPSARLRPFRPQPFGRYTLLSHLATGGMGEIYLARLEGAQGFEKLCVIKKILPQLAEDSDFVERFVGEARTLVRLSHGSIAQVLDMGLHEGEAYMALEYVDGKDLRKVAARVRDRQVPLPLTFILYIMGRVLDALAYAHRKKDDDGEDLKLVHRDISPQNILISYEGEVKVVDFGLAKSRLSAAKTNPSIILGKFLYMSPEQARHQPVDRRSDLYAVGLTLYELIAGKNPFDGIHPGELMSVVANPKVAPLDNVEPLTPRSVTALVAKALEVDPTQRFQTAEEFRGRLQTCLMEIDASAGPESVSRFMRELFTADFQSERRLLASLKDVPRGGVPEPRAAAQEQDDGGTAPRATLPAGAILPAKTIRLDGPVEALSFHPTPRSREAGGPVNDGETRPGIPMDEATRPAFPLEALEEEARARASRLNPDTSPSVEVEPEAFNRPPPTPPPAVAPVMRPPSQTREVPLATVPPEAIPPAPWSPPAPPPPMPARPDMRPTELELLPIGAVVGPADSEPSPWPVEPTEPRAEPLRVMGGEPRPGAPMSRPPVPASGLRPGGLAPPASQPPPAAPVPPASAVMPQRQALSAPAGSPPTGAPARSGALVMPAVSATSGPFSSPPPSAPTRSGAMVMPAISIPASTPVRTNPGGAPPSRSAEPGVVVSDTGSEPESAELPVLTPEQMGHDEQAARVEEMDTNPRASRPPRAERSDDTQPRGPRDADTDPRGPRAADTQPRAAAGLHEDTQPRVVLDESFLRDAEGAAREQEERSGPSRPKTGSRRVRPSSPGMAPVSGRRTGSASVIRPAPAPAPAPVEDEEEDVDVRVSMPSHDETRRTAVPVRPNAQPAARRPGEDTRRTTIPRRSQRRSVVAWVVVLGGLGALLAGAAALTLDPVLRRRLTQQLGLTQVLEGPPPSRPIERTPPLPSESAVARGEPALPEAAPGEGAAAPPATGDVAAVNSPQAAADSPPAPPPPKPSDEKLSDDLFLAPLNSAPKSAPPKSTPPKRAAAPRVRIISGSTNKSQAELKKEWKESVAVFKTLQEFRSCDDLGFLCQQRDDLKELVEASEGEVDPELLGKVKRLKKAAQRQLDKVGQ
ncbi:protein kinase [Myxococcus sp. CA051A]|uniref:serine/threonine-protein kinase n=1 Tax=Myxococcus sp. CA051A TaxID=2741739 RepID=UPI00157BAE64|nr:serine/threonine-protein kinase [Myxococcus sp. CA051A]NTX60875.1 protein kinase [Myxococcus sp. CA051A]